MADSIPAHALPAVPLRGYAISMGLLSVAAAGCAGVLGLVLGDARAAGYAVTALATASLATFLPVFLSFAISAQNFGIIVLAASILRFFILGAIGLLFVYGAGVAAMPLWVSVGVGAAMILFGEAAASVAVLTRIERARSMHPLATQPR